MKDFLLRSATVKKVSSLPCSVHRQGRPELQGLTALWPEGSLVVDRVLIVPKLLRGYADHKPNRETEVRSGSSFPTPGRRPTECDTLRLT